MFDVDLTRLSAGQRAMLALWEEHLKAEFELSVRPFVVLHYSPEGLVPEASARAIP
jgi:hypothetical protein